MDTSSRGKSKAETTQAQPVGFREDMLNRAAPDQPLAEDTVTPADGFPSRVAQEGTEPAPLAARPGHTTTRPTVVGSRRTALARLPRFTLGDRIGRLLLSVVLAALLWFYVVNLENPEQAAVFKGLSVELRGTGTNLKATSVQPTTVDVSVHAPQNVMNGFSQADVRPYVDLTGLGAGVHDVPVRADLDPGIANSVTLDFSPRTLQVQLELQATRVFSLEVQTAGTPAFGFGLEPPQATPSQVQVSGSQEVLSRVQKVIVPVDVSSTSATYQGLKAPVALDAAGKEVTGLTFTPATIQVVVPVKLLLNYKPVPVRVPVQGQPASGYRVSAIAIDPTNVTVCCSPGVIEPLNQIDTRPVAITGTTATVVTTTELILPPNVELYPGQSQIISVTVTIEQIVTTLQLSVAPTVNGLPPDVTAVVSPDRLELTLSGAFEQLQGLTPAEVRAVVDVQGRGPGTYQLQPQIILPQGVKLENQSTNTLAVTLIAPTPVPPTSTMLPATPTNTPPESATPTPLAGLVATPAPTRLAPSPTPYPSPSPTITPGAAESPIIQTVPTPTATPRAGAKLDIEG